MKTAKQLQHEIDTALAPSREEAIAALVALSVARWGEDERAASQRQYGKLSHGLALNTLAHWDIDRIDAKLAKLAKALMTDTDRRWLRQGG